MQGHNASRNHHFSAKISKPHLAIVFFFFFLTANGTIRIGKVTDKLESIHCISRVDCQSVSVIAHPSSF